MKNKYNKPQFIDIVCKHCNLYKGQSNPTFCYKEMYLKNPIIFMTNCYIQLMDTNTVTLQQFKTIFCHSGICNNKRIVCKDILACYELFKTQTEEIYVNKKKNNSYIFEAYPTFFTNNNEKWGEEIKRILSNEN